MAEKKNFPIIRKEKRRRPWPRSWKLIRNLSLSALLLLGCVIPWGLHLTPEAALASSERTFHYGPAAIAYEQAVGDSRFYFGTYGRWFSCYQVKRAGPFWRAGNCLVEERDGSRPIQWIWWGSARREGEPGMDFLFTGMRNDPAIRRIDFTFRDGSTVRVEAFYQELFFFTVFGPDGAQALERAEAYDGAGNRLYQLDGEGRLPEEQEKADDTV